MTRITRDANALGIGAKLVINQTPHIWPVIYRSLGLMALDGAVSMNAPHCGSSK